MIPITDLYARHILDSRGNPTIEVELYAEEFVGSAAVPSGASTGSHEALELRDKGKEYGGLGVKKAVLTVNEVLRDKLVGTSITDQAGFDTHLNVIDGTTNKRKVGANAMLGVSLAACRAASASLEMPLFSYIARLADNDDEKLPLLFANVINGGVHAGNDLAPQEFMIVPSGAKTFAEAVRMVAETYHALKEVITKQHGKNATNVGDEGGFAPPIKNADEAFALLERAVKAAGYEGKICYAMDPAATEFYNAKNKKYAVEKGRKVTGEELADYWMTLLKKYPIISLEDPFAEDDYASWEGFMRKLRATKPARFGAKTRPQIVGDDLTVTNPRRIEEAIDNALCNALLLKVNQIGTLTEAFEAARLAREAGWNVMVSHRSGETEDPFIADLAVGLGCGQIKLGAPCRGERTAKYNQLLRISEEIKTISTFTSPK